VLEASWPWRRDGEWWDSKDKWLREEWIFNSMLMADLLRIASIVTFPLSNGS
jgi:hypothetical protein